MICLGGWIAETLIYGEEAGQTPGVENDFEQVVDMATAMVCRWGMKNNPVQSLTKGMSKREEKGHKDDGKNTECRFALGPGLQNRRTTREKYFVFFDGTPNPDPRVSKQETLGRRDANRRKKAEKFFAALDTHYPAHHPGPHSWVQACGG